MGLILTMRILITGGTGFIGHNVVKNLESHGHICFIADTFTNYGFIPRDELVYLKRARSNLIRSTAHNVDIRDQERMNNMFLSFHPDIVIHLASFPRQKVVSQDPVAGSDVMSTGLINLLELSKTHRVKKFVYISSSMVYGNFNDNVKEDAECNPQGQYGILKLAGEWLVKDYARRGCFNYTIIRPSAVYGELDVEDRVVSKFILSALRNQTLKVNGATEALDFTHVSDTARGIVQAALSSNTENKTYNITRGQSHTLLEAANAIVQIAGQGSVDIRDRDINFPSRGALNIDAAKKDFGYCPTVDMPGGFEKYVNWFLTSTFWKTKI